MTSWQQPSVQYRQPTSLELAKQQTYSTEQIIGTKRRREDAFLHQQHTNRLHEPPTPISASKAELQQQPPPPNRLNASRISTTAQLPQTTNHQKPSKPTQSPAPRPVSDPLLYLRHPLYGLPSKLVDNFETLGVSSIYPWQSACLLGKRILDGDQNLIYTAPTGGGKSLVADVLMLKKVIEKPDTKAILVLPYVALVQEKLKWLRLLVNDVDKTWVGTDDAVREARFRPLRKSIQVMGFLGNSKAKLGWADFDIAVCTIEKANILVNSAIEEGKIQDLGILVLDELHMLDDEGRGYVLELMATKIICLRQGVQIVGMSATLSNPNVLADWLQAKFYVSKYQPVPIEEHIVYDNKIYPTANTKDFFRTASQLSSQHLPNTPKPTVASRIIDKSSHSDLADPVVNGVVALAIETASAGYGALVFCSSRLGAEKTACVIADAMPRNFVSDAALEKRADLLAALRTLPNGYEPTFNKIISSGVGFHHAGITTEERELVAEAYDNGTLKIMVATCSLAAGINLPARRVILHGARMGRELVGPALLRQMRGRAGRKGKDEVGETFLCCSKWELEAVAELLEAEMPPVVSCLTPERRGIKRSVLEVVVTCLANSRETLEEYVRSSLLWQTSDRSSVITMLDQAIRELLSDNLIHQPFPQHLTYEPTKLGCAIVASALTPEDGILVHSEMQNALQSFVMNSEMHAMYLFTPLQHLSNPFPVDFRTFHRHLDGLPESDLRAFTKIGVSPSVVNKLALSGASPPEETAAQVRKMQIFRRAYTSLQLRDLCNEVSVHEISLRYDVPRGQIQNLAQTCHGFAAGMVKFCERMGDSFTLLGAVLQHMIDRLLAGARADLLEMAQVTYVKSRMARLLWENGFKSVRMLAEARAEDLVPVMMLVSKKKWKTCDEDAERKIREKTMEKAEVVVKSAGRVWERMMMAELDGEL